MYAYLASTCNINWVWQTFWAKEVVKDAIFAALFF